MAFTIVSLEVSPQVQPRLKGRRLPERMSTSTVGVIGCHV